MPEVQLESIVENDIQGGLPENWRVSAEAFSAHKTLYDYQQDALVKAARALYLYYGEEENDFQAGEPISKNQFRKSRLARQYGFFGSDFSIRRYESSAAARDDRVNPVFQILSEFIVPRDDKIFFDSRINRMCFWMATGSGKTLIMVKLIEYLHQLKERSEIPPHNILVLAPSDHLIKQIRQTIDEFNEDGLIIDLVPLRAIDKMHQPPLGRHATVYYHRSDNISDQQKEALINWRRYENDGKWYILLDEAHKGGKENSKRQAYYACMARNGFLFNFSATFTDPEDIRTTVKKYNLEDFIKYAYGKNIYLGEEQFRAFTQSKAETSHEDRRIIVLKSLITLAHVSRSVERLRAGTGIENLYHQPLMLTLVNSVNTEIETGRNDLWAFFQTLREIAKEEIDQSLFETCKSDLMREWARTPMFFSEKKEKICAANINDLAGMKIADLREKIFLSRRKGSLQLIISKDNRELALQVKNAEVPFALIRIGDTRKWRNELLAGYEETETLREQSFFASLEHSRITILMGSRSFFESWDSNRPNVINFINIGGVDAKKFVIQSVGRGLRIEPLPNRRRRHEVLPERMLRDLVETAQLPETLFLFATNRSAIKSVLEGLEQEKGMGFKSVEGIVKAERPKFGDREMPLLVPDYRSARQKLSERAKFAMSRETRQRFTSYLEDTPDSLLLVRDRLTPDQATELRNYTESDHIQELPEKKYNNLAFLQSRILEYLSKEDQVAHGIRALDETKDIVHFRQIRAELKPSQIRHLEDLIRSVAQGRLSETQQEDLDKQFKKGRISRETYIRQSMGKSEESFEELKIKNVARHYYVPIVMGDEQSRYIQHIIREKSEIRFLERLEEWLNDHPLEWEAWSFSKIDESLDNIYIPYYDNQNNEYTRFRPDFIFWMCRGDHYQIVFVDPKGTEHASSFRKVDGYQALFEENNRRKNFTYLDPETGHSPSPTLRVNVGLLMFNESPGVPARYQDFWTSNPGEIFHTRTA